jgi:glucose-1-phosphate thymidylyltransferase
MKGVILAAGKGTRLLPVTKVIDKTWLPVYNKPVIFHAIETLARAGIKEILIVTSSFNRKGMEILTESISKKLKVDITFKTKNHDLGMPFSILQAKSFADKESIMVIPGDNVFINDFSDEAKSFKSGATTCLRRVKNPSRFGVPIYKNKKLIDLKEKPKNPPSNLALIAPYFFDNQVYDKIKKLKPSKRGELEVVDLLKLYLKDGELSLSKKTGFWKDIGTFDSLIEASNYFKARLS